MAYSDWGAYVWRNGKRMPNREDVAVFNEAEADLPSGVRIFANLARTRAPADDGRPTPWSEHSHHAVLGDGHLRLCAYKERAELWQDSLGEPYQLELHADDECVGGCAYHHRWVDGHAIFIASVDMQHIRLILELHQPDGTVWAAAAGYLFGAGHTDMALADGKLIEHPWWVRNAAG